MNAVGEEADMDFEIAMPLIHPQTTVLWQTDDDWYDKEILKGSKIYTGFFNSESMIPQTSRMSRHITLIS